MGTSGAIKSDGELVEASRRGEHEAFGQLVARYQDLVCAVSYSSTGDDVLSEDVAQETFIAAWRQLAGLREPRRLRPWLCGIARNLARKARKARRRDELVENDEPMAEGNPFDDAARGEVERLVRDALHRVPETYREVLVLYYRESQSIRDIAEALDTSEAAVMQRLSRGRRYLADGVTTLVERSLRGERPRRDLVAAVLAAIAVIAVAPHVDAKPRPKGPKGSTMLKLALAATATVAAGTTVYLISSHDSPARTSTAAAVAKPQARPSLRLGEGKHGITHTLALGPTAAPREIPSRSIAESDLALLPADSEAVLGLNFGQLQHSALWQRYVAPLISADDVQAFGMKCGFDPVKSLGAITIGVTGITSGSPTGTLVLHGFDRTKALACFEQHATGELEKSGVHVSVDRGVALIDSPDSTQHVGFGFIDDSTAVAVFGPEAATRDAIERVIARAGQHGSSELTEVLQNVNTDASLWVVASQGSPLVGSANGTLAPYTSQRLHTVYMSLDVTDSLALDAGVQLGSPADVAAAIALFTKQIDAIDPDRSLRQRFDQLDVFADGSDLIISAAIAGDQLPMLVGAAMHATLSASIH
jgi:RNA polymerase sigma factor (sigma-70 family)